MPKIFGLPPITDSQKHADRTWRIRKKIAQKKVVLPASFNDCMAFFTGYRKTTVKVDSQASLLKLAAQCADYCRLLQDKESFHLLIYSVVRRINRKAPMFDPNSFLLILLDMVVGDSTGLYERLYDNSIVVNDMVVLFKAWLKFIETKKLDYSITPFNGYPEKDPGAKPESIPPLWGKESDVEIPFSRGGGLYAFLDFMKGISTGYENDNYRHFKGIYVTPKGLADRDAFYAYRAGNARKFIDKPCRQRGRMSSDQLYLTNANGYEGFIRHQDLKKMHDVKLSFFSRKHYPLGCVMLRRDFESLRPYYPDNSEETINRAEQMLSILWAPSELREQRLETLYKEHISATDERKMCMQKHG